MMKSSGCVKGRNKYQKGAAKNLRSSLPSVGNSDYENIFNHGVKLTLAQSLLSGKLQIRNLFAGRCGVLLQPCRQQ